MGNEALVQAGIRLVVVFITAGLAALGANLTILQDAVSDPVMASMIVAVATAVINGVLKYLGGATEQPAAGGETPRGAGRTARAGKRPNPFAI